jgi:hypothetical protein
MHAIRIIKALMRTSFCGLKLICHLNKEIDANKLLGHKIIKIQEQKIQNIGKIQKFRNKSYKNLGNKISKIKE